MQFFTLFAIYLKDYFNEQCFIVSTTCLRAILTNNVKKITFFFKCLNSVVVFTKPMTRSVWGQKKEIGRLDGNSLLDG